jgi:DNA polymerase-1
MILEVLKENFDEIFFVDTEFRQDLKDKGERPSVVCAVYKGLKSQQVFKHYGDDLNKLPPCKAKRSLFVAYNVVAEAACFKNLGITIPQNWWDCFIENKKLYLGRIAGGKGAFGLIRTAKRYGIECMSEDRKQWEIEQILHNPEHPIGDILDYCLQDVLTLEEVFYAQLKDIEETFTNKGPREIIQHALFHGLSMAYTAVVEHNGIPIDNFLYGEISNNFPMAKEKIVEDINSRLNVYDSGVFSQKKFKVLVARLDLLDRWPCTPSGQLSTTEKVIYKFAQENETISELYFCKEFVDSQKLKGFIVGPDGRARTGLNMFGTNTGRTNQSTSRYPFNTAKPMRNIVKPNDDCALISADWKGQEIAIAAYLSNDHKMISDYRTEDIYMTIAIKSGAAPKGAIKASHPVIRNNYKVVLLATLYGQGAKSLAAQLDISIDEAVKIQQDIKNRFCIYFEWIDSLVNRAMVRGYMSTKFGWRYWISKEDKINPRSLFNFPIQAHGSEMLRLALIGLVKEDIEVNALIHDGIIVQCKSNKFHDTEKKVSQIMENASRLVMDGNVCPVDITPIKSNFKQDKEEQIKFERMMTIIRHPSNKSTGVVA